MLKMWMIKFKKQQTCPFVNNLSAFLTENMFTEENKMLTLKAFRESTTNKQ